MSRVLKHAATLILVLAGAIACESAAQADIHWQQILARLSDSSSITTVSVLFNEIPTDDWLDPKLHQLLRKRLLQPKQAIDYALLGSRLKWAFARDPSLASVWLNRGDIEGSRQVFKILAHNTNVLDTPPTADVREVISTLYPESRLKSETLKWLRDGTLEHPEQFEARRLTAGRIDELCAKDPIFLDALVQEVGSIQFSANNQRLNMLAKWAPHLAVSLMDRKPEQAFWHHSIDQAVPLLKAHPELRAKVFAANPYEFQVWKHFLPELGPELSAQVQSDGLFNWLGRLTYALTGPNVERWLRGLPESWVAAQLMSANPQDLEVTALSFLKSYGLVHPTLKKTIIEKFPLMERVFAATSSASRKTPVDGQFELSAPLEYTNRKPNTYDFRDLNAEGGKADWEDRGRLALDQDNITYRGITDWLVSDNGLFGDARSKEAAKAGMGIREAFLEKGTASLAAEGVESNPFGFLKKSLDLFIRSQVQFVPKLKPLPPDVIERMIGESMEGWPEDPSDPEDTLMRREYEKHLRKRLMFEEVPSKEMAARRSNRATTDPIAFAAWKKRTLKQLETRFKQLLNTTQKELEPYGVELFESKPIGFDCAQCHFDEFGSFVDSGGAQVQFENVAYSIQEKALLAGPTSLDSEQLARRLALISSQLRAIDGYSTGAQSLQNLSVRPEYLLNYYGWKQKHEDDPAFTDKSDRLDRYLWSKINDKNPNIWRQLTEQAILENRPVEPLIPRSIRDKARRYLTRTAIALSALGLIGGSGYESAQHGPQVLNHALDGLSDFIYHPSSSATQSGGTKPRSAGSGKTQSSGRISPPGMANPGEPLAENGAFDPIYNLHFFGEARPEYYTLGFEDEFAVDPTETLKLSNPNAKKVVTVSTPSSIPSSESGLIPIVKPQSTVLSNLTVTQSPQDHALTEGKDYVVLRDLRTHELAIKILHPDSEQSYGLQLSYTKAPIDSFEDKEGQNQDGNHPSFDPILKSSELKPIDSELRAAGFENLPKAIEEQLRAEHGKMKSSELMSIFNREGIYSFRPISVPKRATPAEWEQNPYLAYSVALDESGTYAAVCGAQNLLETAVLNEAFRHGGGYHAEVRPTFVVLAGDTTITGSGAHARTYVYPEGGGIPIVLDATPFKRDFSKNGENRTDPLPTHGSTPGERQNDRVRIAQNAYIARKKEEEDLERFFADLEEKNAAAKAAPETAEEYLLRQWYTRLDEAKAAGERHPDGLLSKEEALRLAEPAYQAKAAIERTKSAVALRGNELRRLKQLPRLNSEDPVVRATALANRAIQLVADAPDSAEWARQSQEIIEKTSQLKQYIKDLETIHGLQQDFQLARARRQNLQLTPDQQEVLSRLKIDPMRGKFPDFTSLNDPDMQGRLMTELGAIDQGLKGMNPKGIEALRQVRLYQPEQHQSKLGRAANCLSAVAGALGM